MGTDGQPPASRAEELLAARLRLAESAHHATLDEVLRLTLDEAERLTGGEIGFFHFLDPDGVTLSLQSWSSNTIARMCSAEGKGQHYPLDRAGVWVDCVRLGRPVIHNDYEGLEHRRGLPPGHARVVRELLVPVWRGGKIVAILGTGNKPTDYDEQDLEAVALLASLAWDIVLHKRAEEELRSLNASLEARVSERTAALEASRAELERLNGQKNRLLGTAAHDLRNPLTAVQAFAELLEAGDLGSLDPKQREVLRRIRASSEYMLALVNDLLDVSKIEAGRLELRRAPQDLLAVVREAVATCQLLANPKRITIAVTEADSLPIVFLDRTRIEQVLSNLIGNAIKYSHPGSAVEISVRRRGSEAHLCVRDRGRGIAPERIGSLFRAFATDGEPGTGGERATGLGLAIARRMIEAHGGRIWVTSEPGIGSCFCLALPLDDPASEIPGSSAGYGAPSSRIA